ncbi:MAG: hypothetical protein IJ578_00365 [Bacteroidales bacterium]|nr:hypothetical protein [Bacteroidales bacterium]
MNHFRSFCIILLCCLLPLVAKGQGTDRFLPTLASSSLVSTTYSGGKVSNFNLSIMEAVWKDNGQKGFSGQISYDLVIKQFMNLNAGYRFCPQLLVKIGDQKMMFLNEMSTSPRTLEASGYSMGMSYLGGYTRDLTGLSSRSCDWGVSLSGDLFGRARRPGWLSYFLGVFQGNGFSLKDVDHAKNITGLLVFRPTGTLKLSVGGMLGKYTVGEDADARLADRNRLSAGLFYEDGRWFFKSETVYGKTDALQSWSVFGLGGIWFRSDMALAVRADRFQQDLSRSGTATGKFDLCFSHVLNQTFRYRVQYSHSILPTGHSDAVSLGVSMRFSTSLKRK